MDITFLDLTMGDKELMIEMEVPILYLFTWGDVNVRGVVMRYVYAQAAEM